jgi:hypothetical protein
VPAVACVGVAPAAGTVPAVACVGVGVAGTVPAVACVGVAPAAGARPRISGRSAHRRRARAHAGR